MQARNVLFALLSALVMAAVAYGGSVKSWSATEVVTSTDLNANFTHLHTLGHTISTLTTSLTDCDAATSKVLYDSTSGSLSCGTLPATGTTSVAVSAAGVRTDGECFAANFTADSMLDTATCMTGGQGPSIDGWQMTCWKYGGTATVRACCNKTSCPELAAAAVQIRWYNP